MKPLKAMRNQGFGLIELMVALTLGLLVMGAAFAVFQSNQSTFRANEGVNRIQETARVAFELMSRDIRAAGGSACSSASVVETTDANSLAFRNAPVTGTSTALTVMSGDDANYRVVSSDASSVTIELPTGMTTATDAFQKDDWLLLCNARKTFIVQADDVGTDTITFASSLPEDYNPTADELGPPASVVIAKLRSVTWSVSGDQLVVSRFGGANEVVADGVQNMALSYLQSNGAGYTATPTDWNSVVAVRIGMTLGGEFRELDGTTQDITRTTSNVVSLRSRTL